jgi:hypothetical protein
MTSTKRTARQGRDAEMAAARDADRRARDAGVEVAS